jgi:hypothetical protein
MYIFLSGTKTLATGLPDSRIGIGYTIGEDELKASALSLLILFEYKDIVLVRTVVDFLQ